jgi:hypothetical protein
MIALRSWAVKIGDDKTEAKGYRVSCSSRRGSRREIDLSVLVER